LTAQKPRRGTSPHPSAELGASGPDAYALYRRAPEAPPAPRTGTHSSASQYGTKKSPELCAAFLMWLAKGYVPLVAAQNVGIARSTAFTWKREDPDFAAAWAEAVEAGVDLLEQEALRRARDGVDRPVFQGGVCVGLVREYSDTLMAMLLSGRRAVYRRNYREEEAPEVLRIIFEGGVAKV